jgi:exoribonuclease R
MAVRTIVGVLELTSKYLYGLTSRGAPIYLFRPYDETEEEYVVGSSIRDRSVNQIALVNVPCAPSENKQNQKVKARGELVRFIGPVGDRAAEKAALLLHYCPYPLKGLSNIVVDDVVADSQRIELSASAGWIVFHIDPAGCRDIDDALAWNPVTEQWAITIADAAASVTEGSEVDDFAKAMGSTFYDLDGKVVRPMLPPQISEGSASLLPGERRRGVTMLTGPTGRRSFALSWITVEQSFSYESFPESDLAKRIERSKKGPLPEPHAWIENAMVTYNTMAAEWLKSHGLGLLRVQDAGAEETKWPAEFAWLAREAARYERPADPDAVTESENQENQGHAGLGLSAYCHASSPLRRYADLVNQRALKSIICGPIGSSSPQMNLVAHHLNERSKAVKRWERDLTFLTHVTPGLVHIVDVKWVSDTQVWVPDWKRLIRIRHERGAGQDEGRISIYCDPTRRNWKQRVLTAPLPVLMD